MTTVIECNSSRHFNTRVIIIDVLNGITSSPKYGWTFIRPNLIRFGSNRIHTYAQKHLIRICRLTGNLKSFRLCMNRNLTDRLLEICGDKRGCGRGDDDGVDFKDCLLSDLFD